MNARIAEAKNRINQIQSSIPKFNMAERDARFDEQMEIVREIVGLMDRVSFTLDSGQCEKGFIGDSHYVELFRLSPWGYTPIVMVWVNGMRFNSVADAAHFIAEEIHPIILQ